MNVKLLGVFLLLPTISFSLTLQEMVVQTIDSNPLVKIQKQKKKASEKRLRQVYSDYLPTLNISANVGVEQTTLERDEEDSEMLQKYDASVLIKENVFKGLDTKYGVEARKAGVKSSAFKLVDEVNSLSLEAVSVYLNLLKARDLVEIAQENVNVHDEILTKIRKKVKAGVERQSLYDQTLSRSESAKSALLFEEQNYENALESFKRILDIEITYKELVEVILDELPFSNKDVILEYALKNHPSIKYNRFDIEESRANYRRSASKYYPTIDLQAEAKFRDNINGQEGTNNTVSGLVVINYNLYNGGADQAIREENMHIMLEREGKLEDAKSTLRKKLFVSWNTYEFSSRQLVHLKKHMTSAEKTVKDYHKEYELGRRSLVDLLNSELELNAAKNKYSIAYYKQQESYYELLAHSGVLLEKFEIVIKQ